MIKTVRKIDRNTVLLSKSKYFDVGDIITLNPSLTNDDSTCVVLRDLGEGRYELVSVDLKWELDSKDKSKSIINYLDTGISERYNKPDQQVFRSGVIPQIF